MSGRPVGRGGAEIEVGTALPPLTVRFTRADLVRYAGASTDFNPIHYSERFAAQVGTAGGGGARHADHGRRPARGHRLGG